MIKEKGALSRKFVQTKDPEIRKKIQLYTKQSDQRGEESKEKL